jgi:UDP-glucose 4-epimerase
MKTAVVTGASGFIGSYLVRELAAGGYRVYAVVRPGTQNLSRLEGVESVSVTECDLRDIGRLPKLVSGHADYFFHLAWAGVSGGEQSDYEAQMGNIRAALSAMDAADKLGCSRFIGAGSLHEVECTKELEQNKEVKNQGNAYKTAKLAAHYYCKLKASAIGMDFLWPRLTNAYGAGEISARLVNSVIRHLMNGEEPALTKADQLYDFIYVTDAAKAYRLLAEQGTSFRNYTIGGGDVRPLKEYLEELRDTVAPGAPLGFGKHPYSGVYLGREDLSSDALCRDTGFRAEISFQQGIRLTSEYIRQVYNGDRKESA